MNTLANVKPENRFYCADGSVLHSLTELEQKLRTISNEAFRHHVNEAKNDFHNWVRDVFQDYQLAEDLLRAKTPAQAAAAARRRIREAALAEQEIESAINIALMQTLAKKTASAPAAGKKGKKRKSLQRRRKKSKNRKLNKKRNRANKGKQANKGKRNSRRSSGNTKRKAMVAADAVKKHIKKHVGQWLKWLSVNPKV